MRVIVYWSLSIYNIYTYIYILGPSIYGCDPIYPSPSCSTSGHFPHSRQRLGVQGQFRCLRLAALALGFGDLAQDSGDQTFCGLLFELLLLDS